MARDIVLEVSSLWDASAVGLTFTIPAGLLALARHFYKAPLPPGVWEGSLASNALMSGKLGEWPNAPPLLQLCLRVPVFIQGVMLLNLRTCVLPTFISIFQHGYLRTPHGGEITEVPPREPWDFSGNPFF